MICRRLSDLIPPMAATLAMACGAAAEPTPALFPQPGATGVCPDAPLHVVFDRPVSLAAAGTIRLLNAATGAAVETIDLSRPPPTETVGGLGGYHYRPVIVSGREAWIFPQAGVRRYGAAYAVSMDAGCFRSAGGESPAIAPSAWSFTTRPAGPRPGSPRIVVAADGSGDFCTVQAALDFIPAGNTRPVTIFVRRGTYRELLHVAGKDAITIIGENRAETVLEYPDNARFNPADHPYRRGLFLAENTHDLTLENLTIRNTTPQGGSQAEAIILHGGLDARTVLRDLDLYSYQDTLQIDGQAYVSGCHIEGDVDFLWGTGPVWFERSTFVELRSNAFYTQVRNPAANHGFVFHACTFTGIPGVMGNYLSRIQPARFPASEVVLLECTLADSVSVTGWLLQGTGSSASLHFWEYGSREPDGHPADVRWRPPFSRQFSSADRSAIGEYFKPAFVLGGWSPPAMPPRAMGGGNADLGEAEVGGQLALLGTSPCFAAPEGASYHWFKNGTLLPGANERVLQLGPATWDDAGIYVAAYRDRAGRVRRTRLARLTIVAPATAAPPQLPVIALRHFPATDYGASPSAGDNAAAIQRAIDAAAAAGGGIAEVPAAPAPYLSGPIRLASHVELLIDEGAVLEMLPFGTYPRAGPVYPTFISGDGLADVAIAGGGVIEGQGAPWWRAFRKNKSMPHRPFMIRLSHCERVLLTGLTLRNSPMFQAALGANNLTVVAVTVSANPNSPNTDGVDPAGSHQLIQNCTIADGDDNIAVKAGADYCSDITVADCWFGAGHGMSVGGQTTRGLDGLTVQNCTFRGTTSGLRLKADPTQGGPARNIRYTNLRMTGVEFPIVFYSYYSKTGSPGARTTPARVLEWNADPPYELPGKHLPTWSDIGVSDVTADAIRGASTVWGLPLPGGLFERVRFRDVRFADSPSTGFYDASDIQLDPATNLGPVSVSNALVVLREPASVVAVPGSSAEFSVSAFGSGGAHLGQPRYEWQRNGQPLSDGPQPDGSFVKGAATPRVEIDRVGRADAGTYTVQINAALDAYSASAGRLEPGSLPVSAISAPARLVVSDRAAD